MGVRLSSVVRHGFPSSACSVLAAPKELDRGPISCLHGRSQCYISIENFNQLESHQPINREHEMTISSVPLLLSSLLVFAYEICILPASSQVWICSPQHTEIPGATWRRARKKNLMNWPLFLTLPYSSGLCPQVLVRPDWSGQCSFEF